VPIGTRRRTAASSNDGVNNEDHLSSDAADPDRERFCGQRWSAVPKAFRNVEWCNENDACIVFSRNALQFNTIDDAKPCPITSVNESPPRTYEINYECGGKGFIEKFILQSPERLVQRYWAKQPVGHWGYLLYTPR
jgi:hypothetical protein